MLDVVFSLQVFDIIYVMTGGGPGFSTTVLVQYVFRSAFNDGNRGYASAVGVLLVAALLLLTVIRNRLARRSEGLRMTTTTTRPEVDATPSTPVPRDRPLPGASG